MKWFNHMAIAGATCAVISPALVPVAILGSTAPDWLEWVGRATGRTIRHRSTTHYFIVWLVAFFGGLALDSSDLFTSFAYGGLTHILCDAMTVSGVPFGPQSDRRFHLFGGRFRTGDPTEYGIAFGVVALCAALVLLRSASGWYPFFYDWAGLYNSGVIDGAEWRANRFRFF